MSLKGAHATNIINACKLRKSPSGHLGVDQKRNTTFIHFHYLVDGKTDVSFSKKSIVIYKLLQTTSEYRARLFL